ncbi:unnamed protein product, partial [Musa textilis]
MEGIGTHVFRSVQSFWRHRGYRRLEGPKKQAKAIRLGGGRGGTNSQRLHRKARVVWPTLRLRLRAWPGDGADEERVRGDHAVARGRGGQAVGVEQGQERLRRSVGEEDAEGQADEFQIWRFREANDAAHIQLNRRTRVAISC